ncbi:MAG: hypothetical protein HOW97_35710 [Catenulispora sp.]|nr:hypothetical protein [Catenulispora sp.]
MGDNYYTVLVAAEMKDVVDELPTLAPSAFAKPAAPGRTVVSGEFFGPEEANDAAARLSRLSLIGAVAFGVYSSDALSAILYRDGAPVHCYDSTAQTLIARIIENGDGPPRGDFENPYYLYEKGDPDWPSGVRGADPDWLLPFAAGPVDREVLAGLLDLRLIPDDELILKEDGRRRWLFAGSHHAAIAKFLHLDPEYLCGGLD